MIKNKWKNRQIEIDKKPLNLVRTEEENRSVGRTDYYIFAFLFQILLAAGRLYFHLVLRDQAIGSQTIKIRTIIGWGHCKSGPSKMTDLAFILRYRTELLEVKPL